MTASATSAPTDNITALASAGEESAGGEPKETVPEKLVRLASQAELFHDENGETFISAAVKGRRETWPLKSRGSREYLAFLYHSETRKVPGGQALQDALSVLHGKALYEGPEKPTHIRIAHFGDCTYVDLADDERTVIEIRAGGWVYVADPPVRFRRPKGVRALPRPESGGSIDDLRAFVNIVKSSSWRLVVAWLVSLFFRGPFAWLALQGRQGTGKTGTSRTLRQVIDPNKSPVRAPPRSVRDLVIAGANSVMVVLDNLSYLDEKLSDALCRMSTGGGLSTRELFSDLDEIIVEVQRAGILNGITDVVARGDLLDRCILIEMPPLPKGGRKTEKQLAAEFAAAWPRILGAILDTAADVMAELPNVQLEDPPRMADFAAVGVAVERVLGWPAGTFLRDYAEAIDNATDVAIDVSVIAPTIRKIAENGGFEGTATELLDVLNEWYDGRRPRGSFGQTPNAQFRRRPEGWPKCPRAVSSQLRRLEPTLLARGIDVTFGQTRGRGSTKVISIRLTTGGDPLGSPHSAATGASGATHASHASPGGGPTPAAEAAPRTEGPFLPNGCFRNRPDYGQQRHTDTRRGPAPSGGGESEEAE